MPCKPCYEHNSMHPGPLTQGKQDRPDADESASHAAATVLQSSYCTVMDLTVQYCAILYFVLDDCC